MIVGKIKNAIPKKILMCVISVITIILISAITRGHVDVRDWRTITILSCKQNGEEKSLISRRLKEPMIGRMPYKQPEALKPPRTDVLTVTPWLAPIVWNKFFNIDILNAQFHKRGVHIGVTMFAIKKYTQFTKHFLLTAEKFFMVGHRVTYYVLTDQPAAVPNITLGEKRNLVVLEVPAYNRWQDITMRRMQIIRDYVHVRFINEVDYLVCLDVDLEFRDEVGVEILSHVFGVIHPGFFGSPRKDFPYERRPQSAGYIPEDEGDFYYAGGYFGGTVEEVYKLTNHCHHAMMADKNISIEARWHDESYLNRYFLYYKPTKLLSPEYCWHNYFRDSPAMQKKRVHNVPKDNSKVRG